MTTTRIPTLPAQMSRRPTLLRGRSAWRTLALCAIPGWLGLSAGPASGQAGAMETLEAAAARYADITVLCADFDQLLTVTLLNEEKKSAGELCQRRPNLFSMRFTDPAGDAVVADGAHFWVYYASINPGQVLRVPLDPSRGGLDFYREFLDGPAAKYEATSEGEETVAGVRTTRIALRPLAQRGYRSATVWIDPVEAMIRRVEIVEDNGTVRRVTLNAVRVDPAVGPEAFRFDVPAGVTVINR